MRSSLQTSIRFLRQPRVEGGYVNDPADPGGCTNFGITLAAYRRHTNPAGRCADLKRLTLDQAAEIYRDHYWGAISGDALPAGIDLLTFDWAVNSGPYRAASQLQALIHVRADGQIGPATLRAIDRFDTTDLIHRYADRRRGWLRGLRLFGRYGRGWTYRVDLAEEWALRLARADSV